MAPVLLLQAVIAAEISPISRRRARRFRLRPSTGAPIAVRDFLICI